MQSRILSQLEEVCLAPDELRHPVYGTTVEGRTVNGQQKSDGRIVHTAKAVEVEKDLSSQVCHVRRCLNLISTMK